MREMKLYLVQQVEHDGGTVDDGKIFADYKAAVQYFNSLVGMFFLSCVTDAEYQDGNDTSFDGYSGYRDVAGLFSDIYTKGCYTDTGSINAPRFQPPKEAKDFHDYFEFGTEHWSIQLTEVEGLI